MTPDRAKWTTAAGFSVRLGAVAGDRDNNFNLIRLLAAIAVLVSHAWPITGGSGTPEPLDHVMGHSLGSLAVYVFFALSGFFIAGSFARAATPFRFVLARGARLLPGLAVSLVFVVLFLGPLVTDRQLASYLGDPDTLGFIIRNLTLLHPQYTLGDIFRDNPYPAVEGSLWTLRYEALCYGGVLCAGMLRMMHHRWVAMIAMILYALVWSIPIFGDHTLHPMLEHLRILSLPFLTGTAFWVWRDRVRLCLPILMGTAVSAYFLHATVLAFPALIFFLTYAAFWLGYVPGGRMRQFNRLGDYSYGVYIYAFPLQGFVLWAIGPMTPVENILLALPLTVCCAVASWHLVERPAIFMAKGVSSRKPNLSRQGQQRQRVIARR